MPSRSARFAAITSVRSAGRTGRCFGRCGRVDSYLKRTPIRLPRRHATSHDRFKSSGLMIRMKASGTAAGSSNSISAPLSDRLRMVQPMMPFGVEMDPPLNARCLGVERFSMMTLI
jgi:hypothetical protein